MSGMQVVRIKQIANCLDINQILPTSAIRIVWKPVRRNCMLSLVKDASVEPLVRGKGYYFTKDLYQGISRVVKHCLDQQCLQLPATRISLDTPPGCDARLLQVTPRHFTRLSRQFSGFCLCSPASPKNATQEQDQARILNL